MWFIILLALIVGGVVAWKLRVPIMAKILGQPQQRIQRQLNSRKKPPTY